MSQTVKTLKKIASGEEYRALETAINEMNPENIFKAYTQIAGIITEAEKAVLEGIQKLNRQNKDEDWQKFRAAFASRSKTLLPKWHWINSELQKQKITEGRVFGVGSKGDPLAKTPEGRVVVLAGATAKEGDMVRFQIVTEGSKIDFGRVLELSPDTFYQILTQSTREKVNSSLTSVRERIDSRSQSKDEAILAELSHLLKELEDVKGLASKLRGEEQERAIGRTQVYRRRLLKSSMEKLVFEFLCRREEKEIEEYCKGDPQQIARALSAPGLFRYQAHLSLKGELLAGEKPKGYTEIAQNLTSNMDSMDKALKLLDFESTIEEVYPSAKRYLEKMDRLFENLSRKAMDTAFKLETADTSDTNLVKSSVEDAFSTENLGAELRRVFRSAEEFFELRKAVVELRKRLGNKEAEGAESALHPYLRQTVAAVFKDRTRATSAAPTR